MGPVHATLAIWQERPWRFCLASACQRQSLFAAPG